MSFDLFVLASVLRDSAPLPQPFSCPIFSNSHLLQLLGWLEEVSPELGPAGRTAEPSSGGFLPHSQWTQGPSHLSWGLHRCVTAVALGSLLKPGPSVVPVLQEITKMASLLPPGTGPS